MASSTEAISLAVEHVSVTYPNGHQALRDVSFSLQGLTVCALVGVNGSGKSTLFNTIMGIIRPQTGAVRVNGLPVAQAMRQNGIAYVPQSENIDWHFPILVKDVVMLGRYGHMGIMRHPCGEDCRAVSSALERVGLSDLRHRQVSELSGGQSKRMFVARGIAQGARFMLLDEPFAGVDKRSEATLMTLLEELAREGTTVLVAVHDLRMAATAFDQAVLIDRTVVCQGPADEVLRADHVAQAFSVDAHTAQGMVA